MALLPVGIMQTWPTSPREHYQHLDLGSSMARMKQTARKSTGGTAPRKMLPGVMIPRRRTHVETSHNKSAAKTRSSDPAALHTARRIIALNCPDELQGPSFAMNLVAELMKQVDAAHKFIDISPGVLCTNAGSRSRHDDNANTKLGAPDDVQRAMCSGENGAATWAAAIKSATLIDLDKSSPTDDRELRSAALLRCILHIRRLGSSGVRDGTQIAI